MQSSFPSTDGASQVMCSERAADVCIPASAYPDDLTPSQALVQKKRLTSAALSERTALIFSTQGSASLHPDYAQGFVVTTHCEMHLFNPARARRSLRRWPGL